MDTTRNRVPVAVTPPQGQSQVAGFAQVPTLGDQVRLANRLWIVTKVIHQPMNNDWDVAAEIVVAPLDAPPAPPPETEDEKPNRETRRKSAKASGSTKAKTGNGDKAN